MKAIRLAASVIWFALPIFAASTTFADVPTPGLSRRQPASGRFVKTQRGYMIPYRVAIPGTKISYEMVPIPGGEFTLGSPKDEAGRKSHEGPQRTVQLHPFWIGRYEVTWGEFDAFSEIREHFRRFDTAKLRQVTERNRTDAVTAPTAVYDSRYPFVTGNFKKDAARSVRYPAVSMTQLSAKQYTKWLSLLTGLFYRLPSEAEWEYACRAGSRKAFSFGDDPARLQRYAWHHANSNSSPQPVGGKQPNAWGLCDMHGNAAEWVLDRFDERGYRDLKSLDSSPLVAWPRDEYPRVVRGGSWDSDPEECRSAARRGSHADWKNEDASLPQSPFWLASEMQTEVGFRIVRPLNLPPRDRRNRYWEPDAASIREAVKSMLELGNLTSGIVDPDLPAAAKRVSR